ncbi:hypothetical protein WN943_003840 [Citrus x changshan-huyou]
MCKTIRNQSDSIEWDPSYPDEVVQGNKFEVANDARTGRVKGEYGVELSTCIDAALALMELANESLGLPRNRLYFNVDQTQSSLQSSVEYEENGDRLHKKKKKFVNEPSLLSTKYKNGDDVEEDNLQNKGWQHVKPCLKFGCDPLGMSMMSSFKITSIQERPLNHGLKKGKTDASSSYGLNANSFLSKRRARDDAVPETKPLGKMELPPIWPQVHKGFPFSIMHFLSAIRTAMVVPDAEEDTSVIGKHLGEELVRRTPIDPCILEVREPLEDLVGGASHIFSSKLAPLGAKGWQPLTSYVKSTKSWSWIGPISYKPDEAIEEEVSVEAWGHPRIMLAKLVDSFANWLRSVRETLQQIKSLPAPPMTSMPKTADLEQRLKSARPRKCTATISSGSVEQRAYFHIEEALRYSVPERAFLYTAVDDRPPRVTVLCLVRDAAARLSENIGTRSDVCILMRDLQYIVEDISDEQLNQVVSRGLDRSHYENDPCVQYNGNTKLWVYLHGDREEDDLDDDGTAHIRSC